MLGAVPGDQWALILGASRGMGLACAKQLSSDGFNTVLVFRETRSGARALESVLDSLRVGDRKALGLNVDAVSDSGRERILESLAEVCEPRCLKVVVHSIAQGNVKPIWPQRGCSESSQSPETSTGPIPARQLLTTEDYRMTINAMGTSLYAWASALARGDFFTEDARVLALTSEGARCVFPGYAAVSAAKAVLESIVRALAVELAPTGVRVNAIQAGITDTRSLRNIPGAAQALERAVQRNPLGRLTTPVDVAHVVGLLCRPDASWINGALIAVDGGEQHCR